MNLLNRNVNIIINGFLLELYSTETKTFLASDFIQHMIMKKTVLSFSIFSRKTKFEIVF